MIERTKGHAKMAKTSRKKKAEKKDFNKVKLKVGKRLKKTRDTSGEINVRPNSTMKCFKK